MERSRWLAVSGSILGTIWLTHTIPTTFAFDKPLLTLNTLLLSAALAVLSLGYFLRRRCNPSKFREGPRYEELPLSEIQQETDANSSRRASAVESSIWRVSRLSLRHLLIGALVLRVELLRRILANIQCAVLTWEPLIPVAFACWDYYTMRKHQTPTNAPIYGTVGQYVARLSVHYVVTTSIVGFSGLLALASTREPPSTFICAATLHNRWLIPVIQRIGTVLDLIIAACISRYQNEGQSNTRDSETTKEDGSRLISVGSAILQAAQLFMLWSFLLFVIFLIAAAKSQERWRMLEVPGYYLWSLVELDFSVCLTLLCAVLTIPHIGVLNLCLLSAFTSICIMTTSVAFDNMYTFPATDTIGFVAICIMTLGFAAHYHLEHGTSDSYARTTSGDRPWTRKLIPGWLHIGLLIFAAGRASLWAMQSGSMISHHPIDQLIHNAQIEHESYRLQALDSNSLKTAVKNYRTRYGRHPPPGFDHWYTYATERQSLIIDDYDSIERDVSPFYAITPENIRHYTTVLLQDHWYNVTGICVRDGKPSVCSHVNDDHRWMMERLVELVGMFSKWLPDMDLAFNVNDECRIAVPWHDLQALQNTVVPSGGATSPTNKFSPDRATQWERPDGILKEKIMTELSWQPIFNSHGTVHCPPGSRAREQRYWNSGRLCAACATQHSFGGPFPANWTDLMDVCHQPDLAELHGFYTSPSAFKTSHQLLPIFSQSKAPGFNDVLYPSAWNWDDKAKYAPNAEFPDVRFADKKDSLFWRGTTSEGMSPDTGQWRGQSRQRFLHILNDINVEGTTQVLPLPRTTSQRAEKEVDLLYTAVPITTLTSLVKTDVHFVDPFQRCWDIDCPHQAAEFGLAKATDFQAHWQYKYLLDLDGAGFSGRFLPFMFSRSLPLKATLFKEWWHDRLTAWHHFVPLDIRAHGIWSTLVYFTGMHGKVNGQDIRLPPRHNVGETLADNGREWAEKVLRKDDMEIYFFRLLLEWGRLTDNNRDAIGFVLAEGR